MGPEVRFKSARRCQGDHNIDMVSGEQSSWVLFWGFQVFQTFLQSSGFSDWELFMRHGNSQALPTHTVYLTFVCLSTSVFIMGINFVNFKALFYIVINQFFTVAIIILILHCSSRHSFRG